MSERKDLAPEVEAFLSEFERRRRGQVEPAPDVLAEFRAAASKSGRDAFEEIEARLATLSRGRYPTADCLLPREIERFVADEDLPETKTGHAESCGICKAMIVAADPERNQLFQDSLDSLVAYALELSKGGLAEAAIEEEADGEFEQASTAAGAAGSESVAELAYRQAVSRLERTEDPLWSTAEYEASERKAKWE